MTRDMNYLISVILPVYNADRYLDEAICSILNQTYSNFELIIVNDGSTDGSRNIINARASTDSRIKVIDRPNKGLVASLNEAIDIAKGDLIARMDADDISLPERFEKQVGYFREYDVDIVGGHYLIIDEQGKTINTCLVPVMPDGVKACLAICPPFAHGSVMFSKDFWLQHQMKYGQRFSEAEDYALWQEFFHNNGRLGNIDEFIFKYRQHDASFSMNKLKKMNREVKLLRKLFVQKYKHILKGILTELRSTKGLSFFEEAMMLEMSWLLFKYTGNMTFFKLLRPANKKNVSLTFMKILGGKI